MTVSSIHTSRLSLFTGLLALLLLTGGDAKADPTSDEYGDELMVLLDSIDIFMTAELLEQFGVDGEGEVLRRIALDTELRRYTRTRALHALGFYPNNRNLELLLQLAHTDLDVEVRVSVIYVLSLDTRPEVWSRIDNELNSLLTSPYDEEVRSAVLRAVERIPTHRVETIVLPEELESGSPQ